MAIDTGFPFDRVHLRRGGYHPQGHFNSELEEMAIRQATLGVLTGDKSMKFEIVGVPDNPAGAALQQNFSGVLDGTGALHVVLKQEAEAALPRQMRFP